MKELGKLKQERWGLSVIGGMFLTLVLIIVFVIIRASASAALADRLFGYIYIGVTVILFLAWMKNRGFLMLPAMLLNAMCVLMFFTPSPTRRIFIPIMIFLLGVFGNFFYVWMKNHLSNRRILELVSKLVTDTSNGFTNRPLPTGKISFSPGEMVGFTEFLKKEKIALSYHEQGNYIVTLPQDWFNRLFNIHGSYLEDSRVTFNVNGEVTSVITEKDYKKYRDQLTFDELCANLGNLFTDFVSYYKNGKSSKILDILKKG